MDAADTVHELSELRRGRGLDAADLYARVGPNLRRACTIVDADAPAQVRRKLVLRLTELCGRLPDDLRLAALVALALHEEAAGEFLDRRIAWLADHFDRDSRTARRRIDQAFRLLAGYLDDVRDQATSYNLYAPDGWYVESLKAVLRMDLDPPQLTEERRIVVTTDELDEIVVSLSAPNDQAAEAGDGITAQMVYGGELVEAHHAARGHSRFVIRLPEPLSLGQRHTYSIQFTSYSRALMRPYYVMTPYRRCEHLAVRVRFGHDDKPTSVWRLNGLPQRAVDDFVPTNDRLTIDRLGEVSLEFHDMQQGLSYGLQWSS